MANTLCLGSVALSAENPIHRVLNIALKKLVHQPFFSGRFDRMHLKSLTLGVDCEQSNAADSN
jgi:hypothetical protein